MKLLELSDLHLDPKWLEQQKPCLDLIRDTARKEQVNFICIAGDIYNRPFYNSEKDSIKYVLDYMESLLGICPVVMVTGTPSHDAPGSYHIFEKMGCHVLKPNKPEIINGMLFIGLPEIDKTRLMSRKKLDLEAANRYISDSINTYITDYWAPVREQHREKPCVFLGHGAYVDDIVKAVKNPIIRNTDTVINNMKLREIKADRYILGHFHTPEDSKVLNGGYVGFMGFDNAPWNCTGFQPGFNLTEIIKEGLYYEREKSNERGIYVKTIRIDYPVVRKEKIKIDYDKFKKNGYSKNLLNSSNYDVRINLKIKKSDLIKIDIPETCNKLKTEFNLNSCVIEPDIIREESERITREQADRIKTLWEKYCFFRKWEINSNQSVMLKINEIEKNVCLNSMAAEKKTIKLLSLEVTGSIFSLDAQNKKSFYYDFSNDPTGLTLISGDNGKGKSTFFGFASPYPIFIGFDYRTLKDFFVSGEGRIEKHFLINGTRHQHIIIIPENEKKSIKCFWNVETSPGVREDKIKAESLSSFMTECERFFGPVDSFVSTCFFSQEPHRMKKYVSSLTGATNTELRNAYMQIIGIDRSREKEYAKHKKDELLRIINDLEIEKNTINNFLSDNKTIYEEKEKIEKEILEIKEKITTLEKEIQDKEKQYVHMEKKHEEQKRFETELKVNRDNLALKEHKKDELTRILKETENINIEELKNQVAENDKIKLRIEKTRDLWQELNKQRQEKEMLLKEVTNRLNDENILKEKIINQKNIIEQKIKSLEKENELMNTPCPKCGYIDDHNINTILANTMEIQANSMEISELNNSIPEIDKCIKLYRERITSIQYEIPYDKIKETEETGQRLKLQLLTDDKLIAIMSKIDSHKNIDILKNQLSETEKEISQFNKNIQDITKQLNPFIEKQYRSIDASLTELKNKKNNYDKEVSSRSGLLKSILQQIEKIEKYHAELELILNKLDENVINMTEWEAIESDMKPNKLPALELDLIACDIDFEVNQKLNEKYIIKTNTQYINKKGEIIDNFDILVYNPVSGIEKSLLSHSPGQRAAYFIEPISQALRKKRQEREGVEFMWSVADETDAPMMHSRVFDYYQSMIDSLPEGHTRFVMSHHSEVHNFIKNTIDIESIAV